MTQKMKICFGLHREEMKETFELACDNEWSLNRLRKKLAEVGTIFFVSLPPLEITSSFLDWPEVMHMAQTIQGAT